MVRRRRSLLPPDEARKRYIRAAESVILRQIQADARRLDRRTTAKMSLSGRSRS